jgi:hypothetical protein
MSGCRTANYRTVTTSHLFKAKAAAHGLCPNVRFRGGKQTLRGLVAMSASDPKRTLAVHCGNGFETIVHRDLINTLAARHKLPAVYFERLFVAAGGLISYGSDVVDQSRRAASYVDRVLKGEKLTFPCRRRPSSNWSSTSRPLRHLASPCRRPCSPAPTR